MEGSSGCFSGCRDGSRRNETGRQSQNGRCGWCTGPLNCVPLRSRCCGKIRNGCGKRSCRTSDCYRRCHRMSAHGWKSHWMSGFFQRRRGCGCRCPGCGLPGHDPVFLFAPGGCGCRRGCGPGHRRSAPDLYHFGLPGSGCRSHPHHGSGVHDRCHNRSPLLLLLLHTANKAGRSPRLHCIRRSLHLCHSLRRTPDNARRAGHSHQKPGRHVGQFAGDLPDPLPQSHVFLNFLYSYHKDF